ncbi:MAG: heavy metal translocating P-type ATPase, partial [Gemmatimonadaceae bacterium]
TVVMGAPLVFRTVRGIFQGHLATDIVASLSIVGAIALDQPLAGLVIVLMQLGGETLEHSAEGRASAAVKELEARAPRMAHRVHDSVVTDVPAASIQIGETLLLRPGDVVACDGIVADGESELDTSSLTGEPVPRRAAPGSSVMSGMANGLGSFTMRVTAPAERSQYARIVELVRTAQASKAPLQRMADRYAVWFTPITVAVCAIAVGVTHDWMRALAILVVATPCPLILATPVAIIGGINRAAKRFVVIRNGGILERLAQVDAVVFDKTGTLTVGKPSVRSVLLAAGFDRDTVLRYAASVEQHSSHLLARVLVDWVIAKGLVIPPSTDHAESPGLGVSGVVDHHRVRVGARAFVIPQCRNGAESAARLEQPNVALRAYVSVGSELAAVIEYADEMRPELNDVLRGLRLAGVRHQALVSGDHGAAVLALGQHLGIDDAHGDLLPHDKARLVAHLRSEGYVVLMVGDGINDAPGLSVADVGVALAANGGGVTAQAADVIILVDSLRGVRDAMDIGRRTIRIARQSIWIGLGLSGVAMLVAAFGALPPLIGAALQEAIDVAVILNALRTSFAETPSGPVNTVRPPHARPANAPISVHRV